MAANMYRVGGMYTDVGLLGGTSAEGLQRPAVPRGQSPSLGSGSEAGALQQLRDVGSEQQGDQFQIFGIHNGPGRVCRGHSSS